MGIFLQQYDALDVAGKAALTRQWLGAKTLELFAELRAERPILASPIGVIVTKADEVRSVLDRGSEFTVALYAQKMERITGPFMLGMSDTARYRQEVSGMRLAFPDPGQTNLAGCIAEWVNEAVCAAKPSGRIEIVSQVTRLIPVRLVQEYLGLAVPDPYAIQRWARLIFHDIFLNLANDDEIRKRADDAASEMNAVLDRLISESARNPAGTRDTVLGRLLRMRAVPETALDLLSIRHNFVGMIVGAIDTTSKAATYAIDWLLDHDAARIRTIEAALASDPAAFADCVQEAMRFKPQSTALIRLCAVESILGVGKPHETRIAPGTLVFAAIGSAMFDPENLVAPDEFRVGRSPSAYLHFGQGQHPCFGRYLNPMQIGEMVRQILLLPNVRRAVGNDGIIQHDGPFPDRLVLEFDTK